MTPPGVGIRFANSPFFMSKRIPDLQTSMPPIDPVDAARAAGLRYANNGRSGIGRKRSGKLFRYVDPEGRPIRDRETLARIKF